MIITDLETTGVFPQRSCIVSIGAVNYETDDEFYGECHIYDDSDVHPVAMQINGFSEESIRDKKKPAPHELYWQFIEWAYQFGPKNILAGHNVGHFDILFLEQLHTYLPEGIKFPFSYRTIDTHTLGFSSFGESLTLDQLAEKLGLGAEPKPHNALTGAKLAKSVLKIELKHLDKYLK